MTRTLNRFQPTSAAGHVSIPHQQKETNKKMVSKSKTSFCIDSLLAHDSIKSGGSVRQESSPSSPPDPYNSSRFRPSLLVALPQHPPNETADSSSSAESHKDDVPEVIQQQAAASSPVTWQQPHSISRLVYTSSGGVTIPTSSPTSSNGGSYPSPLFASPAAALHAAAAAAAAAVAASSPGSHHQFHSAHLEWLARAGVLYHRFGADLSGKWSFFLSRRRRFGC